jgi:release factor glutamine methyltransferase
LEWTTDFLKKRGADTPRLDAEVLLAEARGCPRIQLYAAYNESAEETTRAAFRELVKRRAEGTPVAYLVGHREFYSMNFRVTPDVLIPRPETELLVIETLDHVKEQSLASPVQIADVGTGSGAIAVALAKHCADCRVTAIDKSPAALAVARQNAADHEVAERIEFVESDLFAAVEARPQFRFVASNPPYITTAEMAELPKDVKDHEPETALHAGPKGMEVIERLIPQAAERLLSGGWLLIEISPMLRAAAEELLAADARLELGETVKDLAGLPRVVQARRKE